MAKRRKIKKFNFLYCAGIIILIIVFVFAIYVQAAEYFELKDQLKQAQQDQKATVSRNVDLVEQIMYQGTDAYVEKIARERLGLVKPNEIVFIDENK